MLDDPPTVPSSYHSKLAMLMFHENSLRHLSCVNPVTNAIEGILTREDIAHF